ncbi:MAG: DUF4082 domain-containing protein [Anaerolineales bacterium]|nr:DUF4082 domain-containing protein [Anaerolineales bacterium]
MSIQNLFSNAKWNKVNFRIQPAKMMQIFLILTVLTSAVGVNPAAAEDSILSDPLQLNPMSAPALQDSSNSRADALVLMNSDSAGHIDFVHYIQPYLDHFGIPYTLLDISTTPITENVIDYALIIIGHRQLDIAGTYLDTTEQGNLSAAVNAGTGLVNFDNDLSADGSTPHYSFVQDVFGFGYGGATSGSGVSFPSSTLHYIAERHTPGESLGTGEMSLPGVTLPGDVTTVASTGAQPFIAVTTYGAGRAVQWGSYEWMSTSVRGPVYGLDDLVWRSLVWAARKPFVMQGMPPFLTMRSDDESGNFEWIHIANEFGIKPWAGLFYQNIDSAEAADLSNLTNAGLATAAIHAFNGSFFYFNHGAGNYPDATVAANFADGTAWHTTNNIPISDYVLPHYYEFGSNVFQGLSNWGVEFVGTQMEPGNGYGAPWIMNGPFREYETGGSSSGLPMYYADFMTVPGHPEFDGQFFNCVTEIRDDAGYEWYPNLGDVAGTIGRGTRQTKRALDGMQLATLFTHGYFVSGSWGASAPANWRAILQGIMNNLSAYEVEPVTIDYACRYIRATTTSNITSAAYNTSTNQVIANFSGATDIPTRFYLFMDGEGYVMVDVPSFTGTTTVNYIIPGPLDHIVVSPNPATVVAGTTQQFSAVGYDANNNPIPNLTFAWSVVNGGGTIDVSGRFTAGVIPGTYANTVVATRNAISGTASVTVSEPVLHHFEFATIANPKYLNAPFSITLRARDNAGNLVVGYAGTVALTDSTGTVTPTSVGPFVGGAWTGPVTIGATASSATLTATGSGVTGISNTFQVLAAPVCPCSIWDSGTTPANPFNADPNALEVGMKFRAATDGYITALRFYRSASNTGTEFVGHLWTADGTMLAEAVYPTGTPAGWQQVNLAAPVPISSDTTYVVSYHTTAGYAVDRPYFTEGNRALYEHPPLRALVDGEQGGNGVYKYDNTVPAGGSHFPNETYQSSNYWTDVVFETDLTPPEVCVDGDCMLWGDSFTPSDVSSNSEAVELGVRFRSSLGGYITGLRYYRGSGDTVAHPGHLWASNGTLLASLTFPATATAGWQQALFDTPVLVLPNQIYVASYHTSTSWIRTLNYFTSGRDNPPLYAYSSTEAGGPNGLYTYGPSPSFPNGTFNASNYWVDVLFRTQIQQDTTAPSVASTIPAPNANGVDINADVTTTFSEAVDPDTIGNATFELRGPANALVTATVTYDQNTHTARLNPASPLSYSTTYTAVVKGGVYGVHDLAGNPMYGDYTWSFTTLTEAPTLDHFGFSAISSPQVTGTPFAVTITAYDDGNNVFTPYNGTVNLSVSAGTITPVQAGPFVDGVWSGSLTIDSSVEYSDLVVTATDGAVVGQSNSFALQLPPEPPDFYTVTSDSYQQVTGVPFNVTVTTYPGLTINAWEDNHQYPVLATTIDPTTLIPGNPGESDGQWTEFHYIQGRPYPSVLAGTNEENYGLPTMRFYADGIPNGEYQVIANLYDNAQMRYFYGYTMDNPKAYSIDVPGGATGTQHREYSLGNITITNGTFNIYVRDADWLGGQDYRFFGWAWIRLVPVYGDTTINAWEDNHQDPVLTTTTNPAAIIGTDGFWTEFLYTPSRPYPTILAGVDEENHGLPTMRFYADGIPNGTYQVFANLYDNASMRYYYGFSAGNPKEFSIDLPGGATGTQHREYSLGNITITDGTFNIYIRDADWLGGMDYRFFGWAWIRLASAGVEMSSSSATMLFDADGDGIYGEAGDTVKQLTNGAFTISAQESTPGTGVEIIATDNAGRTGSNQYTVTTTNQAPQAVDDTYTIDENTTLTVAAPGVLNNDTDPDSDSLNAIEVSGTTHGTLDLNADGSFTYTPYSGYSGDDTFTYKANDGYEDSNTATVSISVIPNEYTLTIVSDHGLVTKTPNKPTYHYLDVVTLSMTAVDPGWTFTGWSGDVFEDKVTILGDTTVTANFALNQYTITFDSNGGSPVDPITQDFGSTVTAPADPTKAGYTFAGWDPSVPATMPLGGAALTAQWTVNQYTITFDSNGGSAVDPITQDFGSAVTAPADPTRLGYTFAGWDPSVPATMPLNGANLTAQWTANEYTITFDSNGGSAVASITQAFGSSITPPADPTRAGFTFAGWDPAIPATMPLGGAALTAQWTANDYTITFDSNGGSAVDPITLPYGSAVTAPADPTRPGYTFAGWDPSVPATMPLGGATLTAQWTVNRYTITFDSNGGSAVDPITQDFGSAVTAPADPTKAGYTFAGWDPSIPATMPLGGAALTAQWTVNQYTLAYTAGTGGTLTGEASQVVNYGGNGTLVTAVPNTGYYFVSWSDGVLTVSRTDENVTANLSVTATFAQGAATIKLIDSTGAGIAGARAQYYDKGWKDIPGTTNTEGMLSVAIPGLKGRVNFKIYHAGAQIQKTQDITSNPLVVFQTKMVTLKLLSSTGSELTGGAQYYAGGWKPFGSGATTTAMELLPLTYSFRVSYGGAQVSKSINIATTPDVVFQTKLVTFKLLSSTGSDLTGGAQYYIGGWKTFGSGTTTTAMELLPVTYSFRVSYGGAQISKSINIATTANVVFQTGSVHSDSGTCTQYYAGGWRPFTQDMELLPVAYPFRFTGWPQKTYTLTSGIVNHIH